MSSDLDPVQGPATGTDGPRGFPRPARLLADGVTGALAQPVSTATAAVVLAIVCFVILATTGQSAASEQRVISRIDGAGTRLIAVSDDGGRAGMQADGVAVVAGLSDVSWAFGLGAVTDVQNARLPTDERGIAARALYGEWPPELLPVQGRLPRAPGEALAGRDAVAALHLADGAGTVQARPAFGTAAPGTPGTPVVGVFEASGPLGSLNNSVLIAAEPAPGDPLRYVYVMAEGVGAVEQLGEAITAALPAVQQAGMTVETPEGALALRSVIAGEIGAGSRQTMALVLAVGLAIVTVTMLGAVSAKRRDFGRRRALGATRSALVVLVLVQTAVAAVAGIALGVAAGLVMVDRVSGTLPSSAFVLGVVGLTGLVALIGAVPPALAAAYRDPLRILRVP